MKKIEDQPWWDELIGVKDAMSLRQMSERFGVSPAAIANALKRNGIDRKAAPAGPRSRRRHEPPVQPRGRQSKLDKYIDQIGKVVDREIAERAGVTVSAVTNYRKRNNIKASGKRGRPRVRPNPTVLNESVSTVRGARGYKVIIGGEAFVVIAADIAEAAAAAAKAGRGEVTHVELLGRALKGI
ncbi:MAG: hypothetical protein VX127_17745 [Myxococcota bacterium]|nr:hypothetical protein [Myxococcota bacterium]